MRNQNCPLCSENIIEELKINLFKCQNCEIQFINNIEDNSYYNNYFKEYRSNPNDQEQKKRIVSASLSKHQKPTKTMNNY